MIQPYVELTEFNQVTRFPARLAGTSNSLRVYVATVSYKQARQYPYGAIARPEVKDLCNSAGDREVIGTMGYITSKAMIKEIIKGAECNSGTKPVSSVDSRGVNEALVCANYPVGSIRYSWRAAAEVNAEKAAAQKAANASLEELQAKINTLLGQITALSSKIATTEKLLSLANTKLKKICSAKPKPKGC